MEYSLALLKETKMDYRDQVSWVRLPSLDGENLDEDAPIILCKMQRWKRKNEKGHRLGMYSYQTGEVVIPERVRKSLDLQFLTVKDKDRKPLKVPFIVSEDWENGYELYDLKGIRLVEGAFKECEILTNDLRAGYPKLQLTRFDGKKALFNEHFEMFEFGWVDAIYQAYGCSYTFCIWKEGKKAATDGFGHIIIPWYNDFKKPITLRYSEHFSTEKSEEVSIVSDGKCFGIFSLTKGEEIYPVVAKEIRIAKESRPSMNSFDEHIEVDVVVIVKDDETEEKYDFTSLFKSKSKRYKSLYVIYGRNDYEDKEANDCIQVAELRNGEIKLDDIMKLQNHEIGNLIQTIEFHSGKIKILDKLGLEEEKIGEIDAIEPIKDTYGYWLIKGEKRGLMARCHLEIPFYDKVTIPPEFKKYSYEEKGRFALVSDRGEDGTENIGVYSCKTSEEILPPKYNKVTIELKNDWRRKKKDRKVWVIKGLDSKGQIDCRKLDRYLKSIMEL